MNEQALQRKILAYLKTLPNAWAFKTITTNRRGVPDLISCIDGRFVALEVKAPGKLATLTAIQQHQIDQIRLCGGRAEAVDSLNYAVDVILSVDTY